MVMKCTAACLVALALLGSFCDAQWDGRIYNSFSPRLLKSPPAPEQVPLSDTQQKKQPFAKDLDWKYPEDPKPEVQPDVPFVLRHPVAVATVAVQCRENDVYVEVQKDFFGNGQLIHASDLSLGNCAVVAESPQVLILDSQLQDCGSSLMMTENSLIYTFTVNYNPQPLGNAPVVRTSKAAVHVECHYPRKHNVSSLPLDPLWVPFAAVKVAEEFLYFSMKLMTDDWQYVRPSYQYYLGDIINIEASVKQYFHAYLRVFVDYCVATLSHDDNSNPRYVFIENGCLLDAAITGSTSKFMPRTEDDKLHFQLEAFRFQGATSGLLYITCHVRATLATDHPNEHNRACSYINGVWKEAGGADAVCGSCASGIGGGQPGGQIPGQTPGQTPGQIPGQTPGQIPGKIPGKIPGQNVLPPPKRPVRHVPKERPEWEGKVTLGPFSVDEREEEE
uniref:Zona pellucida sperm-binding protein 3 n=1 Tax=Monopterus albus TaxID=43700 RepID=A0A3Q3IRT9_MONAL|nr:zona pellucida sperm-binding protein 3-like [Monopterus albus]